MKVLLPIILGIVASLATVSHFETQELISPVPTPRVALVEEVKADELVPTGKPTQSVRPAVQATVQDRRLAQMEETDQTQPAWTGTASYYSREGCVGCSADLRMANGRPLDDKALTVAFNRLPMGSYVTVTNPKTGLSVRAEVTDTGGFERHGRIIDLTVAVRDAVKCTNLCYVEIYK